MIKKLSIIIALFTGFILIIIIGSGIILRLTFTPQKIKFFIIGQLSELTHREIFIKSVHIGIFNPVIELENIKVARKIRLSSGTFIEIDKVLLYPRIGPLLSGDIIIRSVVVIGPKLNLINLSDTGIQFNVPKFSGKIHPFVGMTITKFIVDKGEIDYLSSLSKVGLIKINEIKMVAKNINLNSPFNTKLVSDIYLGEKKFSLVSSLYFNLIDTVIDISESEIISKSGISKIRGKITNFVETPYIDIYITTTKSVLDDIKDMISLPFYMFVVPKTKEINLHLKGNFNNLTIKSL